MHFNKIRTFFYGFLYFGEKLWVADTPRVIFCIVRYAIFSLRYTFFKFIMQRTNTEVYSQFRRFEN